VPYILQGIAIYAKIDNSSLNFKGYSGNNTYFEEL
jgi:hypothetical protein